MLRLRIHRPYFPNWTLSGYFSGWKGHLFWLIDFSRLWGELISYTDDCLFPRLCIEALHSFIHLTYWVCAVSLMYRGEWVGSGGEWAADCASRKDLEFIGKNTLVGPSDYLFVDHNKLLWKAFCTNARACIKLCAQEWYSRTSWRGHLLSTTDWKWFGPACRRMCGMVSHLYWHFFTLEDHTWFDLGRKESAELNYEHLCRSDALYPIS